MSKQEHILWVLIAAALPAACTILPPAPVEPSSSGPIEPRWIEDTRAYSNQVADDRIEVRRRQRKEALSDYLAAATADHALRLLLVTDASVQHLDEAFEANDALSEALETPRLDARRRALLISLQLLVERRTEVLRTLAETGSELAIAREARDSAARGRAALARDLAKTRAELAEAEAKINALKSIEQSLGGNGAGSTERSTGP